MYNYTFTQSLEVASFYRFLLARFKIFPFFFSLSPGSSTECRSPSPFSLAPKKRFKIDALKDINHEEIKKSPFRPWMDDSSKNVIKSEPPALIPAGLYHPYLLFLQHPKALELTGMLF